MGKSHSRAGQTEICLAKKEMVFRDVALKSSTFIFEFPSKAKVQSFTPTDPHPRVVFCFLGVYLLLQRKRGTQTKGQAIIETTKYLTNPC